MSYWEDELDDVLDESVNEGHDVDYPRNEDRRSDLKRRIKPPGFWICPECNIPIKGGTSHFNGNIRHLKPGNRRVGPADRREL